MEGFKEVVKSQTQQDIHRYAVAEDEMVCSLVVLVLRLNSWRIWWWAYH